MAELYRYAAFISYSSGDSAFAKRLHRALESFGVPSSLGQFDLIGGGKKNRIYPVFRDREELSAGHLGELIEANLRASAALIVVCSPGGAASPWVEKEIEYFAGLGRRDKIFAIIADTAPLHDEQGRDATASCFPAAFRGDALKGDKLEPLAADARKGKDGFRNAWLKIVAGLIGVSPGQLIDRDRKRRREQRMQMAAAAVAAVAVAATALGFSSARTWRTAMAANARDLYLSGRTLDSLPFAIASAPAPGSLLAIAGGRSSEAISARAEAGLVRDLGVVAFIPEFSPDSAYMRVQLGPEDWRIVGGPNDVRIDLPQLGPYPVFSPAAPRLAFSRAGGAYIVDLASGRMNRVDDAADSLDFSPGGSTLSLHSDGGFNRLVDVRTGAVRRVESTAMPLAISPDGNWLAGWRSVSDATVRNLETGATWRLGRLNDNRTAFQFSPDSHFLATVAASGGWQLMDLRTGREIQLGDFDGFGPHYTPNARWLIGVGADLEAFVLDLTSMRRVSLGPIADIVAGPDGDTVVITAEDEARIVNLATGHTQSLGRVLDWAEFSSDGQSVLGSDLEGRAFVFNAQNGDVTFELGETYARPAFTSDGRRVAARTMDGAGFVIDLASGVRAELGYLADSRSNGSELSGDGKLLATWDRSETGYVFDLDRVFEALQRGVTRRDLCAGEAGALVRSFAPESRTGETLGRPWNPCDWRGLGAILPDPARGDGWFEGLRQWWRLRLVRWRLAPDYACGEVNASGATSAARVRSCSVTRTRPADENE